MNPKYSALRHTAAWLVWLTAISYRLFSNLTTFTSTQWLLITFNYLSILVVFYTIGFGLQRYFKGINWPRFWSMKPKQKFTHLAKPTILVVPLVTIAYVVCSIYLDRLMSTSVIPSLADHIDGRWGRINEYVAGGTMYALYRAGKKKDWAEKLALRKQVGELIASAFNVNELEKKYAKKNIVN